MKDQRLCGRRLWLTEVEWMNDCHGAPVQPRLSRYWRRATAKLRTRERMRKRQETRYARIWRTRARRWDGRAGRWTEAAT